jgi:hypothetical protein
MPGKRALDHPGEAGRERRAAFADEDEGRRRAFSLQRRLSRCSRRSARSSPPLDRVPVRRAVLNPADIVHGPVDWSERPGGSSRQIGR